MCTHGGKSSSTYLPTHQSKGVLVNLLPASAAEQVVFEELILPQLAQMCEYLIPDLCSLPPEL